MSKYTVDYFIDKFSKIPEDKWTTGKYVLPEAPDCHCALGHCGATDQNFPSCFSSPDLSENQQAPEEARVLQKIFLAYLDEPVPNINDRHARGQGPKKAILKALELIKVKQNASK